jgi:hypothetical protein
MNNKLKKYLPFFFSATLAVIILWQMLLPGYLFALDMAFGPRAIAPSYVGLGAASFPIDYFIYLLQIILPGWVVQKAILFVLFFLLFYLPLKFYPFPATIGGRYFAALLFGLNPFVYERFLAGQWKLLFGYALLFPFVVALIRFREEFTWRAIFAAGLRVSLIAAFTLHLFAVGAIIAVGFATIFFVEKILRRDLAAIKILGRRFFIAAVLVSVIGSYWVVPEMRTTSSELGFFTKEHWTTFRTAGDERIGALLNVAALYGFWGEHEPWINNFLLPKSNGPIFGISGAALLAIILAGAIFGLRDPRLRVATLATLGMGAVALVFSAGVGETSFHDFNLWLFEHLSFWSGFRDSEKWSAVLALSYVILSGIAVERIFATLPGRGRKFAALLIFALPILYTSTMLFGFSGQLRPVWYPEEWRVADTILARDPNCSAIFLPWHEYYTPNFNGRVLTANPAAQYFDCKIFSAKNAEIGGVGVPAGEGSQYRNLESVVTANFTDPDAAVRALKAEGVRWIIFTPDLLREDPYRYRFLDSKMLEKTFVSPPLVLFKIL